MWLSSVPRELFIECSLSILIITWVLLPLVPAILIFLLFPDNKLDASGPMAHLSVRASGASAAYLIILVVVAPITYKSWNSINDLKLPPFWTVVGSAEFEGKTATQVNADSTLLPRVILETDPERLFNHKTVSMTVRIPEENDGKFPILIFKIDEKWKGSVDLNKETEEKSVEIDNYNKIIKIMHPISIRDTQGHGLYPSESPMENASSRRSRPQSRTTIH
jgi:hypothetical protein